MTTLTCARESCQLATSGKCLEGFEPVDECPYQSTVTQEAQPDADGPTVSKFVDLPSGDALSEDQVSNITSRAPTRVVVVAGPFESGKTTIITSIYEALMDAPFGGYLFAGSQTLVGFEKRCHEGRIDSGRTIADTPHTSMRDGHRFLHLHLANKDRDSFLRMHLLMSDISGEQFIKIRDSSAAVQELKTLPRADHLCIAVDGRKIIDPAQRHSARNDARAILRSIIEAGVLSPYCEIDVVFTKWDLVSNALQGPQKDVVERFVLETKEILRRVPSTLRMRFFEIAARPTEKLLPFAHGVPTLLRAWLQEPQPPQRQPVYLTNPGLISREMSRLSASVLSAKNLEATYDVRWL